MNMLDETLSRYRTPISTPKPTPSKPRSLSPTTTRTPTHALASQVFGSKSITPKRPLRHNPLSSSSSKKAVVRYADRNSPIVRTHDSDDEGVEPAFAFGRTEEEEENVDVSPVRPPFPTPNRKVRPVSPSFAFGTIDEPKATRPSVQLRQTPSEVMAEFENLPDDVFEEDYQPTPTLAEVQPTQLALHLRSSSDLIDLEASQSTSQTSSSIAPEVAAIESETETEMEDVQIQTSNESVPPPKKHVAFQIDPSQSSATLPSQDSSSTPVASASESDRSNTTAHLQLSQTSTSCEAQILSSYRS